MNAEFETLWQEFLDGGLSPEGFKRLDRMLRDDPDLARHAADLYEDHRLLGLALRSETPERFAGATLARLQGERNDFALQLRGRLREQAGSRPARVSWRRFSRPAVLLASAAAAVFAVIATWRTPVAGTTHMATLLWAENGQWKNAALRRDGERLLPGQLELEGGSAVVRFDSGAIMVLSGPAALQLETRGSAVLHHGKVTVRAPAEAVGFTLRTPASEVVDLGTEFAVLVERSGATEVHVLEGEVEYRRLHARPESATLLTGGHAVRFDAAKAAAARPVELDAPRFDQLVDKIQRSPPPQRLLAYEGFDYVPGPLAQTAAGGVGWIGAWRLPTATETKKQPENSAAVGITADTLHWSGFGDTRGGALEFPAGLGFRVRQLAHPIALGEDGVHYISLLLRKEPHASDRRGGAPTESTRLTLRSSRDYWGHNVGFSLRTLMRPQITCGKGNTFNGPQMFPPGETLLLVGKISANRDGEDEVFFKVYTAGDPIDLFEPADWTLASRGFFSNAHLDLLVVTGDGLSRRWIDEIRLGTSWDAVVPASRAAKTAAAAATSAYSQ